MCRMISILVSRSGAVFARDGVHSHSDLAKLHDIDEDQHLKYEFHLDKRELFQDFEMDKVPFKAKASHDQAAQSFFDSCAGTPELLVKYVQRGNWDESVLSSLLSAFAETEYEKVRNSALTKYEKVRDSAWTEYDKVRDSAWTEYDKVRDSAWAEYDKVRRPAGAKYDKVCASTWTKLFLVPENRIEIWK